jgi:8-oxo-dGTP diphosphatase
MAGGSPEPRAVEHAGLVWVDAAGLAGLDWLPADRVLLPELAGLL